MVLQRGEELVGVQDPRSLLTRTLADRYDLEHGNRPVMALVGHGLIVRWLGHGSALEGADRDVALIESKRGWSPPPNEGAYFRFPSYAGDPAVLERATERIDRIDGRADGAWRGKPLEGADLSATPAFGEFQTETIEELIRREGMGRDDVPDVLLVNYNQTNEVGHLWSMNSPQMADAVRSSDQALGDLVAILNREVGRGRWVLAVTADHGSTPDTSVSGAFVIDHNELTRDLQSVFDRDDDGASAIQGVRVTQVWLDEAELADAGYGPAHVARFLRGYTQGENRIDPRALPPGERAEPVFEAAFASHILEARLDCPAE
jgi:hypothetical protein